MKVAFLLLLLSLVSFCFAPCPHDTIFDAQQNKCYLFIYSPLNFPASQQKCANRGGSLTAVRNAFENSAIVENAQQTFLGGLSFYWIGGNDNESTGSWTWIDGTPFGYKNWAPGFPVTNASNYCIAVDLKTGKWLNDGDCLLHGRPYVCEIPLIDSTTPQPTACPLPPLLCPSEWIYFQQTDSCYKVFFHATWSEAEETCAQHNSHLTSIHSENENAFIVSISTAQRAVDSSRDLTWIGLMESGFVDEKRSWLWTDGSRVDYLNWSPGQPSTASEHCVQIFSDFYASVGNYTQWNDYDCTANMRNYVCKRNAQH